MPTPSQSINDDDAIAELLQLINMPEPDANAIRQVVAQAPQAIRNMLGVQVPLHQFGSALRVVAHVPQDLEDINPMEQERHRQKGRRVRQAWCAAMQELLHAGLAIEEVREGWELYLLQRKLDAPTVHFLLDQGVFSASAHQQRQLGAVGAVGLLHTLRESSADERKALLPVLHHHGVLGGDNPLLGVTDFIGAQLMDSAESLIGQGFPLEACRASFQQITSGLGPIETYLGNLSPPQQRRPQQQSDDAPQQCLAHQQQADAALVHLRQLWAWGARLGDAAPAKNGSSFALATLLGAGNYAYSRTISQEMLCTLGDELLRMGCDLNDGSQLAERLAMMQFHTDGYEADALSAFAWDWACAHGFDPSRHASALHCVATHQLEEAKAWSMVEHYVHLGARLDSIAPTQPSPVQKCVESSQFTNVWKLVAAGAPLHYVDEKGEGVLHFLAERSAKNALPQLNRCLKQAPVVALIHQGSTAAGKEGEQPLHRACAALNLEIIERLVNAGASINAQDAAGWTPLRHALRKNGLKAQEKALPAIRWLLDHGADPSICDTKGQTPMQGAAAKAFLPALAELLKLRPQDVAQASESATVAHEKLKKRGGQGASLAEWGALHHELGLKTSPQEGKEGGASEDSQEAGQTVAQSSRRGRRL